MATKKGKVILAGAGPGDAELITVKLQRYLKDADIIITDRLVNPEIISRYAKPDVIVLSGGKQGYNEASQPQSLINQLMIDHAKEGKMVLRLKGGDVAFFSNMLDELIAIQEAGLSYEIIPGITAAAGAAAYMGIPLTARGVSKGVQFVRYNPASFYSPEKWKSLAENNDTLVFYMAAKNIVELAATLLRYTRNPETPVAVIEEATTSSQEVYLTTLQDCETDFSGIHFRSPSLVIIGRVLNFHKQFNWYTPIKKTESVFNELVLK